MNIGYILGPAGSGKSTLTRSLYDWMNLNELDIITLNLDPGVIRLPYSPDIDVRKYVDYEELVDKYQLGPNGGLVLAVDHVALAMDEILNEINEFGAEYMLVDFPGQIETVAFRTSGKVIIDELSRGNQISGLFLIDPLLCSTASSFVSILLFGISITYRLNTSMNYLISKSDLIKPERLDRINEWSENNEFLYKDLLDEKTILNSELSKKIADIILMNEDMGEFSSFSSETNENVDTIFAMLQRSWLSSDVFD